jgi:hypothetical protein
LFNGWGLPETKRSSPLRLRPHHHSHLKAITITTLFFAALCGTLAKATNTINQTNFGTGEGNVPAGDFVASGSLFAAKLSAATRSGTFHREDSGYTVALTRLYDGVLGPFGSSGLDSDGNRTVMPDQAVIRFGLDGAYDITAILTYASRDDGRSSQGYAVDYATLADSGNFVFLHTVAPSNNASSVFPLIESEEADGNPTFEPDTRISSTITGLTSGGGVLSSDDISLRFIFNGYQNGVAALREFQITGAPKPTAALIGATGLLFLLRRKR